MRQAQSCCSSVLKAAPPCLKSKLACKTGERKSKRARKGRATITASALTTLWHVKLAVTETLNVHAKNARVYAKRETGWQELQGDDLCLGGELLDERTAWQ